MAKRAIGGQRHVTSRRASGREETTPALGARLPDKLCTYSLASRPTACLNNVVLVEDAELASSTDDKDPHRMTGNGQNWKREEEDEDDQEIDEAVRRSPVPDSKRELRLNTACRATRPKRMPF